LSKIAEKLSGLAGVWDFVLPKIIAELKKQAKDLVLFWGIADDLGADLDLDEAEGWKVVLAAIEWVALHGTPTEEKVAPFLRRKKLIPAA